MVVNKVVEDVLGGMREYIYNAQNGIKNEIKIPIDIEPPTPVVIKPSMGDRTIVLAVIASESEKAVNLRVFLDPFAYKITFPFSPAVYVWVPKKACLEIKSGVWEVNSKILIENAMKSLSYLKKSLHDKYGFSHDDLIALNKLHLKKVS